MSKVVDLFAGPGGWSKALQDTPFEEHAVEWDKAACDTRRAAGFHAEQADIALLDPSVHAGAVGLIASPPCQAFSAAGRQRGLEDDRGKLVYECMRWADILRPEWVAFEQVPTVLPIFQEFATDLELMGYSTWTGILNAADYGTPQARKRAILVASRIKTVDRPEPTHAKDPQPTLFGQLKPWVPMGEALGWKKPAVLIPGGRGYTKPNRRPYTTEEPAPTIAFGHDATNWVWTRPATTVVGSFRPDIIAAPGYRKKGDPPRQKTPGSVQVTVQEAGVLQGFPKDFPWQGSKTKQYQQAGNAIPVQLARAVIKEVSGK